MKAWRRRLNSDEGWTLIETITTIVLSTIIVLGLGVTLLAFKEQLDRSWSIRVMDQYANDVIETITHDLRNATEVTVRPGTGNTSRIEMEVLDPLRKNEDKQTVFWRADPRTARIWRGNSVMDKYWPPNNIGVGEGYQIVQFTVNNFGTNTYWEPWARQERTARNDQFMDATFDIDLILRYVRNPVGDRDYAWDFQKHYSSRVYTRNSNLIIKKGITGSE